MRVILIRSNPVKPDPPVDKMIYSLTKMDFDITVLAWDRNNTLRKNSIINCNDKNVEFVRFGIPASFGGGIKKNFFALVKFQFLVLNWLILNKKNIRLFMHLIWIQV